MSSTALADKPAVKEKVPPAKVEVGQIWKSRDWRHRGDKERKFLVTGIEGEYALTKTIKPLDPPQPNAFRVEVRSERIRLDRFKQTSTGYDLVSQPPG